MSSSNIDFDATLVDWLYGELDAGEVSRFEAYLEAHPTHKAEAHALREMRASFEGFPEAEPPQAAQASLMHQAARAAQPKGGVWAAIRGFFQPLALHPAAAAMATVVLVGGVAGALYVRNGDMQATTTVRSSEEAPRGATASAALKKDVASRDPSAIEQDEAAPVVLAEAPSEVAPEPVADLDEGYAADIASPEQEELLAKVQQKAPVAKRQAPAGGKKRKRKAADMRGDFALGDSTSSLPSSAPGAVNAISGGAAPLGAAQGLSSAERSRKNAPAAPTPSAPTSSVTTKSGPSEKNAQSWEERQVEQFQFAARGKRCRDAGRIANDLKERSPKTYARDVKGSREESDCSYYIASETRRRSRAKTAKKRAAESGKGKSVPKRATAAPAEDSFEAETAEGL